MVKGAKKRDNKNKDKAKDNKPASKARTSLSKEQSATARAGEEEAPSTSQREYLAQGDAGVSGDDDGSAQQLTSPFTAQQDEQIAAFFGKHQLFYDMAHCDYKNKRKREHLVLEFAQALFPSGKCFLSFQYIFHKRVSSTSSCKISCENFKVFIMPNEILKECGVLKVVSVRILCAAQTICVDYLSEFGHLDNETKSSL